MRKVTIDKTCVAYADKGAKVLMKPLANDASYVLIEGDSLAFEFLGQLFLAHARGVNGCGFQLHPEGPGSRLFAKGSKLGLYLHCLPCDNDLLKARTQKPKRSTKPK